MPHRICAWDPSSLAPMSDSSTSAVPVFAAVAWATMGFGVLVTLGGAVDSLADPTVVIGAVVFGAGAVTLVFLGFRSFAFGHVARRAAVTAGLLAVLQGILMAINEAAGWLDDEISVARMAIEVLLTANVLMLFGALALAAWWGSGFSLPRRNLRSSDGRWLVVGASTLLVLAATGALNSLSDAVLPADAVAGDLADEFGPAAPALRSVGIVHPLLSVVGGMFVAWIAAARTKLASQTSKRLATALVFMVLSQMFIGIASIFFLTPTAIQVIHLAVANVMWIVFVVLGASVLGDREVTQTAQAVAG